MGTVLWPLLHAVAGRSGVVEEWHRPVGVICAGRFGAEGLRDLASAGQPSRAATFSR